MTLPTVRFVLFVEACLVIYACSAVAQQGIGSEVESNLRPTGLRLGTSVLPDNQQQQLLAFSAYVDGNWDIYTWDFDPNHQPIRRTSTPYDESGPSLSPDHTVCVYETVDGRLWKISLSGEQEPAQLPHGSDQRLDMHPSISPAGDEIAIATSLDRTSDDSDLIVYNVSRDAFEPRLRLPAYQHYPCWSPDGLHLAFSNLQGRLASGGPISELWVMRTDHTWARQLTMLDGVAMSPSWSPQGDLIAFSADVAGGFDICVVDPLTRKWRRLTSDDAAETDPSFSPDGKQIMFVSNRGGILGLWCIGVSSGQAGRITPFGKESKIPCRDPDWR